MKSIPPLQDLLAALQSPNWRDRFDAVDALREMGPQVPGVIEAIMQATGDEDHSVRRLAMHSLNYFGRVYDPEVKAAIICNLEKLKQKYQKEVINQPTIDDPERLPTEAEIQAWEKEINDGEPFPLTAEESLDYIQVDLDRNGRHAEAEFTEAAERSSRELPPALKPVAERILGALEQGRVDLCLREFAQAQMGKEDLRKILLIALWKGKNRDDGHKLGDSMHAWLAASEERMALLVELLEYRDGGIENYVSRAFQAIGGRGIPCLIQGLRHSAPLVRERAADILGLLGRDAMSAEEALRTTLRDTYAFVRQAAAFALLSVGTSMGIPFHQLVDFEYQIVYSQPIDKIMHEHPEEMRAMIPALREIAKSQLKEYRGLAVSVLRKLVESH